MKRKNTRSEIDAEIQRLKKKLASYRAAADKAESQNRKLRKQLDQERELKKHLAYNSTKYNQIIESIQEGYFETDLEGHITFCNNALLKISGYTRETLIGAIFSDFTPPRTARAMQAVFGRVFKTGKDADVKNYEVYHQEGHTLIIEFAASLIKDHRGEPVGFRGVLRDVSEQVKSAENDKRIQVQLQQAQKMEALGTLAAGLAHGFNNVLMAIQGNLSIIRMTLAQNHPMQKYLERISLSTEKGGQLSKEILSFAKVGKYVVMPTDLNKILKSTSRMFMRSNSRFRIREIYETDLWQTRVDRVQIGQVLLSLYLNAAEALPQGGDIYLQSENVNLDESYTKLYGASQGRYVKISVTDSGSGLSEEAKRRIFEPFYSPYRPMRYDGLGLAAAYGTIKSHNGIISVYSEEGFGTTFNIYLPATSKDKPGEPVQINPRKGTETVLLIEDDPVSAQVGRNMLEPLGYRIMVATTGTEAIEIYSHYKDQIHLVILDYILPDIDGRQVFLELKKHNPEVIVILTSGYNVNQQIANLLKYGCVDFIQKPFQIHTLSVKIRMALDRDPTGPQAVQMTL